MHGLWIWLACNSAQLQILGSIGAVMAAIALAIVAVRQARAADAQAKAAEIQAQAATAQVEAANRQIAASFVIGDTQTSPNIAIGPTIKNGTIIKETLTVLNNGSGTATQIQLCYRDQSVGGDIGLRSNVLVVGETLDARFDNSRATASGFKLTYETAFGTKYELVFDWDVPSSRPINIRRKVISRSFPDLNMLNKV